MSKTCGHSKPCGCSDQALTTQAPCETGTLACPTPDPCPETFRAGCVVYTGDTIVDLGLVKGVNYNWSANYTQPTPHIWQNTLDSADTEVVLIYRLPASYTKITDTNPSVKLTFDVTNAIASQWFKVTNDDSSFSYACTMYLEKPLVTMAIE